MAKVRESEGAEFCGAGVCRTRQAHMRITSYTNYTLEQAFRGNEQLEQEPPYLRVRRRLGTWAKHTTDSVLLDAIRSG